MPLEEFLVPLQTPCVYYCEDLLQDDAPAFYDALWKGIPWQTTPKINRWVHLQLADGLDYKYRDAPATAVQHGWHPVVDQIRHRVQDWYQQQTGQSIDFNVCLLNFYQDGNQRIGWHADREEIGRTTPIASVSLGATRQFLLRSKTDGVRDRASLALAQGSVVFMENICQHQYLHAVPRESSVTDGRINLTFRCSHGTTEGEQAHERRDNFVQQLVEGVAPQKVGWAAVGDNDDESQQSHVFGNGVRTEPPSSGEPPAYIAKTNLGAECYCAAELQETFPDCTIVARHPVDGYVAVYGHASVDKLVALRTPHHVMEYHVHFALDALVDHQCPELSKVDGETLYQYVKKELVEQRVSIPSLETAASFRVTCDRIGGPHAFKSPEVEREIGGAIMEFYSGCKPKMEDYDIHVRADVTGYNVVIGSQLNVEDMTKNRHFLRYRNLVSIKTNIAYAMIRCAGVKPGDFVLDPFCGGGTLLLEALDVFGDLRCLGMDVNRRSTEGAKENAIAEGYDEESCRFITCDARGLRQHVEEHSVDAIVSNLPWGVMTGASSDLATLYEIFLRSSWYVLKKGGRIAMLVLRGLQLTRLIRKLSGKYRLLSVNVVRTTNNLPCLIVVEKLEEDVLIQSIKGQLAHLNQYVNVSPEIFEAIHMETIE